MEKRVKFRDVALFDDRWIMIGGIPIAGALVTMLLFGDRIRTEGWGSMGICMPVSLLYTAVFWFGMRWLYVQLRRRFPDNMQIRQRLPWMFVLFNVLYVVVNFTLDHLFIALKVFKGTQPNPIIEYITSLILCALFMTLYEAISFYILLQRTVAEKAVLERQNVESQLEGLRNQVNPHFLFNSLNTLAYLIPEDADKAVNFLQQLSNVYRYVLESRDSKVIPLEKELDFMESYVFLLKERFGDNLRVNTNGIEQQKNTGIVPLSLQMLFENAIKHNVISTGKPLTIDLFMENGHLVVRNNIQKKNQVMDSTGVGLNNIKDRYRMLTAKEVKVIPSQQYFTVALPVIEHPAA